MAKFCRILAVVSLLLCTFVIAIEAKLDPDELKKLGKVPLEIHGMGNEHCEQYDKNTTLFDNDGDDNLCHPCDLNCRGNKIKCDECHSRCICKKNFVFDERIRKCVNQEDCSKATDPPMYVDETSWVLRDEL